MGRLSCLEIFYVRYKRFLSRAAIIRIVKKIILIVVAVLVLVGGLVAALLFAPNASTPTTESTNTNQDSASTPPATDEVADAPDTPVATPTTDDADTPTQSPTQSPAPTVVEGRYQTYSTEARADTQYSETILFFHAAWCPECRAFEQAILASDIPDGVQILKVDYDDNGDLRSEYGVTLQSTFVKVGSNGQKISTWVGYGRDKSVDLILENT